MDHEENTFRTEEAGKHGGVIQSTASHDGADSAPEDGLQKERQLDGPEWAAARKRYMRKLNFIILPTISLLYFFEYLDRGNVAVGIPRAASQRRSASYPRHLPIGLLTQDSRTRSSMGWIRVTTLPITVSGRETSRSPRRTGSW